MKLGIATEGDMVCPHFGHAPFFTLVEISEGKAEKTERVPSPGHTPGALPKWMKERGVDLVISGGMGPKAMDLFTQFGIKTMTVEPDKIETVIKDYIAGTIKEGPSACTHED